MHESAEDLAALQDLLDASYATAGAHLRSIITSPRRVAAEELVERLRSMRALVLATVTADGRPIVGPVAPRRSRCASAICVRPGVSATHTPSEAVAVTVHGRATMVPIDDEDGAEPRRTLLEVYTPATGPSGTHSVDCGPVYARIDAERMFTMRLEENR